MIRQESVDELPEGVGVEERRPDHAKVLYGEDTAVDQRLLDDRESQATGVKEAIAQRDRQHDANPVFPVLRVDIARRRPREC